MGLGQIGLKLRIVQPGLAAGLIDEDEGFAGLDRRIVRLDDQLARDAAGGAPGAAR